MEDDEEYVEIDIKKIITKLLDDLKLEYHIKGEQLNGCCPFHDDKHPSFGINFETGLYNCFSCEAHGDIASFLSKMECIPRSEALEKLGFPRMSADYRYTLKDYAEEKNLSVETLKHYRLSSSEQGIEIPYYDESMRYLGRRFRHAPNHEPRFSWEKGSTTTLYGTWFCNNASDKYVVLVEGESDCHCAWTNEIVALGVPRCYQLQKRIC